jgi:hypothetical protein
MATTGEDLLKSRGGRIDHLRVRDSGFDADARIDQAIAESFPASDAPSWNSGLDASPVTGPVEES